VRRVRSHTFMGKRWNIRWRRDRNRWGSCDPPDHPNKTICLDPTPQLDTGLKALKLPRGALTLYLACHEAIHAIDFRRGERWVEQAAADLTRWLWRLGFRQVDL